MYIVYYIGKKFRGENPFDMMYIVHLPLGYLIPEIVARKCLKLRLHCEISNVEVGNLFDHNFSHTMYNCKVLHLYVPQKHAVLNYQTW